MVLDSSIIHLKYSWKCRGLSFGLYEGFHKQGLRRDPNIYIYIYIYIYILSLCRRTPSQKGAPNFGTPIQPQTSLTLRTCLITQFKTLITQLKVLQKLFMTQGPHPVIVYYRAPPLCSSAPSPGFVSQGHLHRGAPGGDAYRRPGGFRG